MMKTDSGFIVAGGEKKGLYEKGSHAKKVGRNKGCDRDEQNERQSRAETGQTNDQNQQ